MNSIILAGALAKAMDSLKDLFAPSYKQEVESYLADSTNLVDLENRFKLLQLRGFVI